jgi:O-antigen ligase
MSTPSIRQVPSVLALAAVATICGWAVTQHSKMLELLPMAAAVPAVILVFAEIGLTALWLWAPLAVISYPLAGSPDHNLNFSRVWIVGLLALLLTLPRARTSARTSSRLTFALVLLATVVGVRTATTPGTQGDYAYGFRIWVESLVLPTMLFAVVRRAVAVKAEAAERTVLALVIAGLLLALAGLAEKLVGIRLNTIRFDPAIGTVRLAGPYEAPEPYGLALVLCMAAALLWLQMRRRGRTARVAGVMIVALELVMVFFTFFRVAWFSAIVVLVASLALRPNRTGLALGRIAVVALVVGLVFVELDQVSAISTRVRNTQNIFVRLGAWEQGIEIFKRSPVFGVGTNQYTVVASQLTDTSIGGATSVPYPHSSFVLVLAEDGVVGVAALVFACCAVYALLRSIKRHAHTYADRVLVATLTGAAVAYLSFSVTLAMLPFGPSNQFFAMLLGIGAGMLDRASGAMPEVTARHQQLDPALIGPAS